MYWYKGVVGPARVAFTDRNAGNLALHVGDDAHAVRQRRADLEQDFGIAGGTTVYLNQVHGADVVDADDLVQGQVPTADAAVSAQGCPLAVMVADCVPVLMVGTNHVQPDLCITAVAHAGRQGLLAGVIEATVVAVRERGATVVEALVGPSVCGQCYEVPAQMAEAGEAKIPGLSSLSSWGTPSLDLPNAAVKILRDMEVRVQRPRPLGSPACTVENPMLSSHRRDPGSGRIVGIIARQKGCQ